MCGRYFLTADHNTLASLFKVQADKPFRKRYNIAPSQPVLAVRLSDKGARELAALEWGFVPEWAKALPDKPLINARSETASEKPSFRASVKRKRCLLPFSGWYEWHLSAGTKQPYAIERQGGAGAFAGIWSVWHGPEGEHWLETVAILTAPAKGLFARVHGRQPLIVPPDQFGAWLEPHDPLPRGFMGSFRFEGDAGYSLQAVSTRVNNARVDDADCLTPVHVAGGLDAASRAHDSRQISLFGEF